MNRGVFCLALFCCESFEQSTQKKTFTIHGLNFFCFHRKHTHTSSMSDVNRMFFSAITPRKKAVPVIDPRIRSFGKVWIDRSQLLQTRGLERVSRAHDRPISLCMLYQNARCIAGERCNQAHVIRSYAQELLHALLTVRKGEVCCAHHGGDPTHKSPKIRRLFEHMKSQTILIVGQEAWKPLTLPATFVAMTTYWMSQRSSPSSGVVRVPLDRICVLHCGNECRWGLDCHSRAGIIL